MKAIAAAFLAILILSGCGTYQQTVQVDDSSYIQLTGEPDNLELIINGQNLGDVENYDSFDIDGIEVTRFEIKPGTHTVELTRAGETIVKRKIYVTEGNVFEVKIP